MVQSAVVGYGTSMISKSQEETGKTGDRRNAPRHVRSFVSLLVETEIHFDLDLCGDRLAVAGGWLEAPAADGFDGFFV